MPARVVGDVHGAAPRAGGAGIVSTEPQVGNFSSIGSAGVGRDISIPVGMRLDLLTNPGAGVNNLTLFGRNGTSIVIGTQGGQSLALSGQVFAKVHSTNLTANIVWALVPDDDRAPTFITFGPSVLATQGADDTGALFQPYASASSAPADGVWHVTCSVTDVNGITLSDGTTAQKLAIPGTESGTTVASLWNTFSIPVKKGTTYTLTGTGLIVLGGTGWLGGA